MHRVERGGKIQMNEQQWFLVKLIIATLLLALLFGWILPTLGISVALVARSLFMAIWIWGLWLLRKIANK